jgi:hypothetical protein
VLGKKAEEEKDRRPKTEAQNKQKIQIAKFKTRQRYLGDIKISDVIYWWCI